MQACMARRQVNVDRVTPMLLPPDLRDWVADNELARFILDAVDLSDVILAAVNERGSGSEQYPPGMMLALLIYCYATGLFSSRRIERATYDSVAVRYICGNHHPDHDTIANFRSSNAAIVRKAFVRVLELSREVGLLKVGTVSIDGTKLKASASKRATLSQRQIEEELRALNAQVVERMDAASAADRAENQDPGALPPQLVDPHVRKTKLLAAQAALKEREEARARRIASGEQQDDSRRKKAGSRGPQVNLSDPQSGLMPGPGGGPFIQGYNAQAAVDADGSGLILGARVTHECNDRRELVADLESIPPELGAPTAVLADSGYDHQGQIQQVESRIGALVYCPPQGSKAAAVPGAKWASRAKERKVTEARERMRARLQSSQGRALYARRQVVSEPVFAAIKNAIGFRRFSMRGLPKVELEWQLVALAYNCRTICRKTQRR
jgi:transposase